MEFDQKTTLADANAEGIQRNLKQKLVNTVLPGYAQLVLVAPSPSEVPGAEP
jgi:hypothetical protein